MAIEAAGRAEVGGRAGTVGSTAGVVAGADPAAGAMAIDPSGQQQAGTASLGAGANAGSAGTNGNTGATYSRVWDEIILAKGCGSVLCHGGGQGELVMDSREHAYANLVNVPAAGPACGASGRLRVKPGDPDASVLLDKISHTVPACGAPMPVAVKFEPDCTSPSPTLCTHASEIALVRAWIVAGASND